jgi:hypothetical protein
MKCFRAESGDSERRVSDAKNASFAANHSADGKLSGKKEAPHFDALARWRLAHVTFETSGIPRPVV